MMLNECSSSRSAKCLRSYLGFDGFSKLPDDIITSSILPRLSLKERCRTSVLSRRWRNLWKSSDNTKLVFPNGIHTRLPSKFMISSKRLTYIRWVDATLETLSGLELLDEFHISFELDADFSHLVDAWLQFAFGKGVKKLHLDLGPFLPRSENRYTFPTAEKLLKFSLGSIGCHGGSGAMSNLMDLSLNCVNIHDDSLQYLLSSCPFLERICLEAALATSKLPLNIVGTSLKLKYLELSYCYYNVKYVISAPNLISLRYDGPNENLLLINVPLLVHWSVARMYFRQFPHCREFSCFCQMKKLELNMEYVDVLKSISFPRELPDLVKLEELKVTMISAYGLVLLWPTVLVKAAPMLKRCIIELQVPKYWGIMGRNFELKEQRENIREATKCRRQHLKEVEVAGLDRLDNEIELVEHLLSLADSLEKLVLGFSGQIFSEVKQLLAGKFAKQLPSDAKVVVL